MIEVKKLNYVNRKLKNYIFQDKKALINKGLGYESLHNQFVSKQLEARLRKLNIYEKSFLTLRY